MDNIFLNSFFGSSPRTRGTHENKKQAYRTYRFIPAYAGNASPIPRWLSDDSVHPRVRGERSRRTTRSMNNVGSSPRTRGTPEKKAAKEAKKRFIPAYAGNAVVYPPTTPGVTVHPRVRGERSVGVSFRCWVSGSSPRTRGTQFFAQFPDLIFRFIPAYAGNAAKQTQQGEVVSVHPRVRGERMYARCFSFTSGGSSPRTRGTLKNSPLLRYFFRFIPAYAGNAKSCCSAFSRGSVHPRVRGERMVKISPKAGVTGSSPRTRGTLSVSRYTNVATRFIPAYAGNAC